MVKCAAVFRSPGPEFNYWRGFEETGSSAKPFEHKSLSLDLSRESRDSVGEARFLDFSPFAKCLLAEIVY